MNSTPQPQPATPFARPQPAAGSPLPFLIAAALLLGLLAWLALRSSASNGGRPAYTLDDAYIHLAMARNAVEHGQLGVNPGEFSAASSSPLWSALLVASVGLVGDQEGAPLFWAALSAAGCLWLVNRFCHARGLRAPARLAACLLVLYAAPLPALVSTGMEHATHLFFLLLLLSRAFDLLEPGAQGSVAPACGAAFLATGFRYESLFLVAPVALVLWFRGRFRAGVMLSVAAFLPVAAFGAYSLAHGSGFLPNSLALKGNFPSANGIKALVDALGYHGFGELLATPHLLSAVLLLLFGLRFRKGTADGLFWVSACLVVAILLHLQFAATGWFFRYEAWLVGAVLPVVVCVFLGSARPPLKRPEGVEDWMRGAALAAIIVLLLWPFHKRGKEALEEIVPASHHIHRQHRQVADFLKASFPAGTPVAVNNLGLAAYAGGCRVLDLWGLGSREVARSRSRRALTRDDIAGLLASHGTKYMVVYEEWFPQLPAEPVRVGDWTLDDPYFPPPHDRITFFSVGAEAAAELSTALRAFAPRLPDTVAQTLSYPAP